ncbi:MAG TPA: hypothetical protein VFG28_15765, partial [Syntrophales bacterium]|nr:hypothetical protein [Syntrophales bacterium]
MKRASIYFITAVALLALAAVPALACNGTIGKGYKAKSDVDYWEQCNYYPEPIPGMLPVGPAYHFQQDVLIHYVGEQEFTATDRLDRNKTHKVTWNRHVDGTATIYSLNGTGTFSAMAMSAMPQLTVEAQAQTASIFPLTCWPASAPDPMPAQPLYNGPFVIQEVVKDIGNDSGCFDANNPAPTSFTDCLMNADSDWRASLWNKVEYLNYHAKITGKQHVYN